MYASHIDLSLHSRSMHPVVYLTYIELKLHKAVAVDQAPTVTLPPPVDQPDHRLREFMLNYQVTKVRLSCHLTF